MGFRDIIERLGEKQKERQMILKQMEDKVRMQKIIENKMKSSNERELEGYINEDREAMIKKQLEYMRKKRDQDIRFGHNPLNTKNITNSTEWEVLREKNQFSGRGNMFANQKNVLKSNRNLLKNNKKLFSGRCTV